MTQETELQQIEKRIDALVLKFCPDYPQLKTASTFEKLWALESTLDGTIAANEDLHKLIKDYIPLDDKLLVAVGSIRVLNTPMRIGEVIQHINEVGTIPANTVCPFRAECELSESCVHAGEKHERPFSCAAARGFAITATRN